MKKILSMVLCVVMLAAVMAGCGAKSDDPSVLKIGGIGPLTGDYATYGVSVKQGAEIAVKEINEAGGINGMQIELMFEDDATDAEAAKNAYNKLMDDGMDVSLGAVTSGACIAVAQEADKDGILMLTPSGSQVECCQYDNGFRICFTDPGQGAYAADFIADNKLASKVAIIYDKSLDYSVGIMETFLEAAEGTDLQIVAQEAYTDQSKTDFSVQLQAVKSSGAELLFLPIYAQEAAYILTQAADIDLDVIFFGVDGMDGVIEKIGADNIALTEGVMLLTPFAADDEAANVQAFVSAYKTAYNATPDQFAADGYDAIYTIKAAIEKAGIKATDEADFNERLIAAMTEIEVEGVTGTMTWTADGEPTKDASAVVITNGVYVAYKK